MRARRTRRDPESRAADVLRVYGKASIPVNVVDIAESLDAEVRYATLDEDLSGILVRDETRKIIGVAKGHAEVRQRYTIAHELGHLLMHPGRPYLAESTNIIRIDRRGGNAPGFADQREEREANQFAAALLMPPKDVLEAWVDTDGPSLGERIEVVAKKFVVSTLAMKFRLMNLGLIGPHNTEEE